MFVIKVYVDGEFDGYAIGKGVGKCLGKWYPRTGAQPRIFKTIIGADNTAKRIKSCCPRVTKCDIGFSIESEVY
ncbi:hypothetical protein [Culicoidibacter larvae]|uniref:Uncharacterized protein n=1 Tax=Culicoidibacter larvae TaxID=2579976 RepID=A0A5R8Q7I6_9FIRM|nr:hypothetical protein [Culicoidibacter larvae]TLG71394.1 hypothetical protein FEZ08_10900 [Culicoidibacter larvae]